MKRLAGWLRWAARIFGVFYLFALLLWAVGTFGWMGQERDPLSAVFLLPLGLPWVMAADGLVGAVLAPVINLFILVLVARWARRQATGRDQ